MAAHTSLSLCNAVPYACSAQSPSSSLLELAHISGLSLSCVRTCSLSEGDEPLHSDDAVKLQVLTRPSRSPTTRPRWQRERGERGKSTTYAHTSHTYIHTHTHALSHTHTYTQTDTYNYALTHLAHTSNPEFAIAQDPIAQVDGDEGNEGGAGDYVKLHMCMHTYICMHACKIAHTQTII